MIVYLKIDNLCSWLKVVSMVSSDFFINGTYGLFVPNFKYTKVV